VKLSVIDKTVAGQESAKIIDEISNASKAGKIKPTRVQRNARFRIVLLVLLTLPIIGSVIFLIIQQSELEQTLKEVMEGNKELVANSQNRDEQLRKLESELEVFQSQRGDQTSELDEIKAELRSQFDASIIKVENETLMRISSIDAKNDALRGDILEVTAKQALQGDDAKDLRVLYQVEYMLKLAEIKLNFDRDLGSAIKLFRSTDSLLAASGSRLLLPLREVLAEEIIQLSAVPTVDIGEIQIQLFSISRRIDALNVLGFAEFRRLTQNKAIVEVFSKDELRLSRWNSFIELLGEVFVWRQHNSDVMPKAEGLNAILNDRRRVNLLLQEANFALSSQNEELFQLCVLKMLDWFERSVLLDSEQIQPIVRDIQSLQDLQLRPKLPNIRQGMALTSQLIEELQL
jgi:uroporphyrin-3 C-methyltransferase